MTGGTRVLGRQVLPRLVEAGHAVMALARSPEKAAAVRAAGVEVATANLFDAAAVAGCDAVLDRATRIAARRRRSDAAG